MINLFNCGKYNTVDFIFNLKIIVSNNIIIIIIN